MRIRNRTLISNILCLLRSDYMKTLWGRLEKIDSFLEQISYFSICYVYKHAAHKYVVVMIKYNDYA